MLLTLKSFFFWLSNGIILGIIISLFVFYSFYDVTINNNGSPITLNFLGIGLFTIIIFIVDFKLLINNY